MSDDDFTAINHLPAVLGHVEIEAKRYVGCDIRDLVGRATVAFNEIEDIHDEVTDRSIGDVDRAKRMHSACFELAALLAAQLAMIEVQHPEILDDAQ